jgi:hypothetical protein
MDKFHLPTALEVSQRVLVAGAGGGFDVYVGLPIYERLRSMGKTVFLSNLSFAQLRATTALELHSALFEVNLNTKGEEPYFPERSWSARLEMCQWIRDNWTRRAYGTRQEVPA